MPPVKTKAIDTSTTNPAEFLAGSAPVPAKPLPPVPSPETPPSGVAAEPPGSNVPVVHPALATPAATAEPNRPGLEAPPAPPDVPDPFILIESWGNPRIRRTLRAYPVPGGCIVRLSGQFAIGATLTESICFVPGVAIRDGRIIGGEVHMPSPTHQAA